MDPLTQGQQQPAETANDTSQQATPEGQQAGLQKRFDELTAQKYAAERALAEQQGQFNQLMAAVTAQQLQAQQAQQPRIEIDPEEVRRVEAVIGPQLKQMQQMMGQLQETLQMQQLHTSAPAYVPQQIAQNPEVIARAQTLLRGWRANNVPATPQDAMMHASAEFLFKQQGNPQANRQAVQTFNAGGSAPLSNAAPASSAPRQVATQRLPDEQVKRLSPDAQVRYWERIVGDSPI